MQPFPCPNAKICHANFGPTAWLCTYRKKGGHNRYFFANAAFEEYLSSGSSGGHTLERHIGKSAEELIARLERRPALSATSSSNFRTQREAEQIISRVIRDNKNQIEMWVQHHPAGMNAKMELESVFAGQTGIMVRRGSSEVIRSYRVRLVLRFQNWHGKPYFVLTAFPKA